MPSDVINVEVVLHSNLGHIGGFSNLLQLTLISCSLFLLLVLSSSFLRLDGSFGSGNHLSLGLLLGLDELPLLALSIRLDLLRLFGLFLLSRLLITVVLFVVLGALEPVHELLDKATHCLAGTHVLQLGVPVKLDLAAVPANEELVLDDAVVVELLAESGGVVLLVRVLIHEELDDRLEQVLDAELRVCLEKEDEDLLVGVPVLDNVTIGAEDGAHAEVELVLWGDVQLQLQLSSFAHDLACINITGRCLLVDKVLELLDCVDYNKTSQLVSYSSNVLLGEIRLFQNCKAELFVSSLGVSGSDKIEVSSSNTISLLL